VPYFSTPKNDRQLTSFATHFTTTSPQKHHVLHTNFRKNTSKNAPAPQTRKVCTTEA
jgi:hypothetical protein